MPLILALIKEANILVIRLICTITYANGGLFGGLIGNIGGIFGKAVFALSINSIVLSIIYRKNPFTDFKKNTKGIIKGGIDAIYPFIIACGIGVLLYLFFNITSAPMNLSVSIASIFFTILAIRNKNNILFVSTFYLIKYLSKGKAIERIKVTRILFGLAFVFAISLPITFINNSILILVLGLSLVLIGLIVLFISKKVPTTTSISSFILITLIALSLSNASVKTYATEGKGFWEFDKIKVDYGVLKDSEETTQTLTYDNGLLTIDVVIDKEKEECDCYDNKENIREGLPEHYGYWHYCENESMTYTVRVSGLLESYKPTDPINLNVFMTRVYNSERFCFDTLNPCVSLYGAISYIEREINEEELLKGSTEWTDHPYTQLFMYANFIKETTRHKAIDTPSVSDILTIYASNDQFRDNDNNLRNIPNGEAMYIRVGIDCKNNNKK